MLETMAWIGGGAVGIAALWLNVLYIRLANKQLKNADEAEELQGLEKKKLKAETALIEQKRAAF